MINSDVKVGPARAKWWPVLRRHSVHGDATRERGRGRGAVAGGALQRQPARTARSDAGWCARGRSLRSPEGSLAPPSRGQRGRARRGLFVDHRSAQGRAGNHTRGRVVARQLPPDRGADPNGPAASSPRLQPRAPQAGQLLVPGISACLRHRDRAHLPRRRARRYRKRSRVRRSLSGGHAATARGALGDSDHAAAGPAGKSAPRIGHRDGGTA